MNTNMTDPLPSHTDAVVGAIQNGDSVAEGEVHGLAVQPLLEFDNEVL